MYFDYAALLPEFSLAKDKINNNKTLLFKFATMLLEITDI